MNLDTKVLIKSFKKDGYLRVRDYLNDEDIRIISDMANHLYELPEVKGSYMKYYEKDNIKLLSRVENFYNIELEFKNLVETKLKAFAELIVENRLSLFKDKINWKLPGGGGFTAHRDFRAWSKFPPKYYVTLALSVDNCIIENGCLEMVSDKDKNIPEEDNGLLSEKEINELEWKYVETSKKDILLFNSLVPHRSGPNKSDNARRMIFLTYNLEDEGNHYKDYFVTKRSELPPPFERDENTVIDENTIYSLGNPIDLTSKY